MMNFKIYTDAMKILLLLAILCSVAMADQPFPPTLNQGLAIMDMVLITLMYFAIVFFGFEYSGHKRWVKLNAITEAAGPDIVCGIWFMEKAEAAGGMSIAKSVLFLVDDPKFKG
jgi:hypothetical protein